LDKKFTFFNEDGAEVEMTSCEVLSTAQLNYVYEEDGDPQVTIPCTGRPLSRFTREPVFPPITPITPFGDLSLPSQPMMMFAGLNDPNVGPIMPQLVSIAQNKTKTLLLEFGGIFADTPPGVAWAVYVGLPPGATANAKSPHFVGNLALLSDGIRGDTQTQFPAAYREFAINKAILAWAQTNPQNLSVTFIAIGTVYKGQESIPLPQSVVHIGAATVSVETVFPDDPNLPQ